MFILCVCACVCVFRGRNLRREEVLGQMVGVLGSLKTPGYWWIHSASLRGLVGVQVVHMRVDVLITNTHMYKATCLIFFFNLRWLVRKKHNLVVEI